MMALNKEVKAVLNSRYGKEISADATDSVSALAKRTETEAVALGLPIVNRVPSTFIHDDADLFEPIPQYRFPRWDTLTTHLELSGIKGGVLFISHTTWQLHFPFRDATTAPNIFAALCSPRNIPLSAEMIQQAPIRAVVLHQSSFFEFRDEIVTRGLSGKVELVVVMRGANEPPLSAPLSFPGAITLQEIHAFPGHVVFVQSLPLAGSNDFHPHNMYHLEGDAFGTYITGLREDALPAWRYLLPVTCARSDSIAPRSTFTVTSCKTT